MRIAGRSATNISTAISPRNAGRPGRVASPSRSSRLRLHCRGRDRCRRVRLHARRRRRDLGHAHRQPPRHPGPQGPGYRTPAPRSGGARNRASLPGRARPSVRLRRERRRPALLRQRRRPRSRARRGRTAGWWIADAVARRVGRRGAAAGVRAFRAEVDATDGVDGGRGHRGTVALRAGNRDRRRDRHPRPPGRLRGAGAPADQPGPRGVVGGCDGRAAAGRGIDVAARRPVAASRSARAVGAATHRRGCRPDVRGRPRPGTAARVRVLGVLRWWAVGAAMFAIANVAAVFVAAAIDGGALREGG